ncbi:MAG: DNA-3-methyladenine glycosylase, partial [Actinomycetota bacterium]
GVAGAVLLRAVQPTGGIELMQVRRGVSDLRLLARGPGRLCQAFGLDRSHNGLDLTDGPVGLCVPPVLTGRVAVSPRIGLREGQEQPWRFYEPGPWASRRAAVRAAPAP